jgi:hypothetical protein
LEELYLAAFGLRVVWLLDCGSKFQEYLDFVGGQINHSTRLVVNLYMKGSMIPNTSHSIITSEEIGGADMQGTRHGQADAGECGMMHLRE